MRKVTVKKIKEWLKSLDENKWRKTYNVDAKRVAHFVNFGEGVDLSRSLQKKSKNANYSREIALAEKYVKHVKEMKKNRKNIKMNESSLREFIKNKIRDLI
jgi:phage-related protein